MARRVMPILAVAVALVLGTALRASADPGKGDNRDDAHSGKVDAVGDGDSGQGNDPGFHAGKKSGQDGASNGVGHARPAGGAGDGGGLWGCCVRHWKHAMAALAAKRAKPGDNGVRDHGKGEGRDGVGRGKGQGKGAGKGKVGKGDDEKMRVQGGPAHDRHPGCCWRHGMRKPGGGDGDGKPAGSDSGGVQGESGHEKPAHHDNGVRDHGKGEGRDGHGQGKGQGAGHGKGHGGKGGGGGHGK